MYLFCTLALDGRLQDRANAEGLALRDHAPRRDAASETGLMVSAEPYLIRCAVVAGSCGVLPLQCRTCSDTHFFFVPS